MGFWGELCAAWAKPAGAPRGWFGLEADEGEMEAAGWTLALFRTLAREEEVAIAEAELDHLRRRAWCLWQEPRPLRATIVRWETAPRVAGSASARDRVVMAAWRHLAEPRTEPWLLPHVWGFRRGRSPRGAVRWLRAAGWPRGGALVRADVRRMFPTLDHTYLLGACDRVLGVDAVGARLRAQVEWWLNVWSPRLGVPVGVSVAPLLSNLYLAVEADPWLQAIVASGLAERAIRYADDFAIVTRSPEEVLRGLDAVIRRCKLTLHPTKTRIVREAGPWPQRVLGEELVLREGVLVQTSPPRRKRR